ncbi:potassium/proton antiporter [uncultured Clostridium sp.]|nr:potassium/proton antiporter [uncultured Clostridium sp.]SCI91865.1 potassium/proton antiporter [uncultured Clostridium sp.]
METSIHTIASNNLLILFSVVAMTGIVCSKLSEKINIPDVVLFLIAGIFIGPSVFKFIDISSYQIENQLILTFGSAFILYLGGKEISLKVLKNVRITVLLLSTLGVLISTFMMKEVVGLTFEVSSMTALLAGAIIASTDPATLVPIFNSIKIKDKVKQTVISEFAFNDATGAILTSAVLAIILSGKFSLKENLYSLSTMVIVGITIGIMTGILLLKLVNDKPYGILKDFAPIISIISVIISYELSTKLGGSGYMSCFIVSVICLIFIVRPVSVILCTIFDKNANWSKKEILFMMWVRETGVIPTALCGIITSMKIPGYEVISSVVFMTILITLIIQGSTTKYIANKLGLLELDNE